MSVCVCVMGWGHKAGQPFILCDANLNGMWADHMPLASPERMEKLKVAASEVLAGWSLEVLGSALGTQEKSATF